MNNNEKIRFGIALAVLTGTVVITTRSIIDIRREEEAKRVAIRENAKLDVQAIIRSNAVISEMIDRGQIRSIAQLRDAIQNEIEFQKIAIREEA